MIIHVLHALGREFDYVVGAKVPGLETTVKLSGAPFIILEGDEYPSSALDPAPKFLKYQHHIGVISGISWDHINIFPTEDEYLNQFEKFADATPKGGSLVYNEEDYLAAMVGGKERVDVNRLDYNTHPYKIENGKAYLINEKKEIPIKVFGKHNMQNISAAKAVLERFSVEDQEFYKAIKSFEGAQNRLEAITEDTKAIMFKDYAHSPSKVKASVDAVKEKYPERKLIACLELHTYSSMSSKFLSHYKNSLDNADQAIIFYSPQEANHKQLKKLSNQEIAAEFNYPDLDVINDSNQLLQELESISWENHCLLMMSSGNFGGMDFEYLKNQLSPNH